MLSDGFTGSCCPFLPQYFTSAILLGDCHETDTGAAKTVVKREPVKSGLFIGELNLHAKVQYRRN